MKIFVLETLDCRYISDLKQLTTLKCLVRGQKFAQSSLLYNTAYFTKNDTSHGHGHG